MGVDDLAQNRRMGFHPKAEADPPEIEERADGFEPVSGEESRTYIYPDGDTVTVKGVCYQRSFDGVDLLESEDGRKWVIRDNWNAVVLTSSSWTF